MSEYFAPLPQQILDDLSKANKYRLADLEQNREGRISPGQVARLAGRAWRPLWVAGSALGSWILAVLLVQQIPIGLSYVLLQQIALPMLWITLGAVTAFVVALLTTSRRTLLLAKDLWFGQAEHIDGRVTASQDEIELEGLGRLRGETVPIYYYCVRGLNFEVSGGGYTALLQHYENHRPYLRVHFAPRSRLLLSVEPVEEASTGDLSALEQGAAAPAGEKKWVFQAMGDAAESSPSRTRTRSR